MLVPGHCVIAGCCVPNGRLLQGGEGRAPVTRVGILYAILRHSRVKFRVPEDANVNRPGINMGLQAPISMRQFKRGH